MTLLIASISADTTEEMLRRAADALERGADAVELRLDTLRPNQTTAGIADALPTGKWIVTCRSVDEGGHANDPPDRRAETLLRAGRPGEGFVDFEYREWQSSAASRGMLGQPVTDSGGAAHPPSLILSDHDFVTRPEEPAARAAEMSAVPQSMVTKLCWQAADVLCNLDAFDILRSASKDTIALCMGETGLLSRVLAKKFDAFGTFCSFDDSSATAPGQPTLDTMKSLYRWNTISPGTQLFGVIGHPVAHSLSPYLFNELFAADNVPGVYLPLLVEPTYDCFAAFLDRCLEYEWLDARGFSVTLPHKEHAWRYLGDRVDPPADVMGAVNTIRIEDGEIWGCNTDAPAAVDALLSVMQADDDALEGLPIDVLGAGGVARAVVAGLVECGAKVTIYNRNAERAQRLSGDFECQANPWDERTGAEGKVLINCTSVGMWPDVDATPMPIESLRSDTIVFDTVYRPRQTKLLRDAAATGCVTVDGAAMFIGQAAMQYEFWTQLPCDVERMATTVAGLLTEGDA